jgi:hypothetical protein
LQQSPDMVKISSVVSYRINTRESRRVLAVSLDNRIVATVSTQGRIAELCMEGADSSVIVLTRSERLRLASRSRSAN